MDDWMIILISKIQGFIPRKEVKAKDCAVRRKLGTVGLAVSCRVLLHLQFADHIVSSCSLFAVSLSQNKHHGVRRSRPHRPLFFFASQLRYSRPPGKVLHDVGISSEGTLGNGITLIRETLIALEVECYR